MTALTKTSVIHGIIYFFFSIFLVACTKGPHYAPVSNAWQMQPTKPGFYRVRSGDTLYAVAFRYDLDYRDLARVNHLTSPYHLAVGQPLRVKYISRLKSRVLVKNKPLLKNRQPIKMVKKNELEKQYVIPKLDKQKNSHDGLRWVWPTQGKVSKAYSKATRNKGIDIAGQLNQPIYASAAGQVAYSGNGLRGYGNLLIIKHNDEYLSAYAHNSKLLVSEGTQVKAGQKIAEMGHSGTTHNMLHFEIRKAGKPVNPMYYLSRN
ncbi:MAG: peptidoglycan DD-metalloendopeptidase family protein [Proteobacteria bacterium]|nr:peptidoglycan DD-metalloendopeptidase family protein [Pseudomonadota bacterium]